MAINPTIYLHEVDGVLDMDFRELINTALHVDDVSNNRKSSSKEILQGYTISEQSIPEISDSYITFSSEDNLSFALDKALLSRHILLLGGIGVGKTNTFNLLLSQLFGKATEAMRDNVTVIFDTKGDFFKEFYTPGDIVIANGKEYADTTSYWNIFEDIKAAGDEAESQEMMCREISKALFSDRKSASQPFFVNAAADVFSKTLIHFLRSQKRFEERGKALNVLNNYELIKFFQQANVQTYINMCQKYADFKGALSYFGDGSSNQALGVFGELNSMLNDYFIGVFARKAPGGREFSMRQSIRKKGNQKIFIEYDLTVGETLTPMYRLLIDLALKEALGRSRSAGDVYMIIDEFKLLPRLQHIDDALNFGRSLGIKVVAGIQNITQLYDIYGESRGAVIASGFSNLFAFRTIDAESRDYVSKVFGRNYYSMSYFNSAGEFVDENREGHSVEDWELMDLEIGQAVIGLANYRPFYFSFKEYESNKSR